MQAKKIICGSHAAHNVGGYVGRPWCSRQGSRVSVASRGEVWQCWYLLVTIVLIFHKQILGQTNVSVCTHMDANKLVTIMKGRILLVKSLSEMNRDKWCQERRTGESGRVYGVPRGSSSTTNTPDRGNTSLQWDHKLLHINDYAVGNR